MTTLFPTDTLVGWMSPSTSSATPARVAYGTDCTGARGFISSSAPTLTPMYRTEPSKTLASSWFVSPSDTEK
jgi:hypothetical protein